MTARPSRSGGLFFILQYRRRTIQPFGNLCYLHGSFVQGFFVRLILWQFRRLAERFVTIIKVFGCFLQVVVSVEDDFSEVLSFVRYVYAHFLW